MSERAQIDPGFWLAVAMACVTLPAGCDTSTPIEDSGQPIAWVGGEKLTPADLPVREPLEDAEQRRQAIDRGIDDLLVAREARRRGLGYTEQAVKRIIAVRHAAELRERQILRDVLYDVVASEVEVSDAEMREEFELLNAANRRRLVTLRSQTFASRSLAERSTATDAGATQVGPVLIRELTGAVRKAVKKLDTVGDATVVAADDGWLRVELVAERAVPPPPFERARDAIEQRIRRRKADAAFERELERLRAATEIRLEPGVIDNDALWPTPTKSDDSNGSDGVSSPRQPD